MKYNNLSTKADLNKILKDTQRLTGYSEVKIKRLLLTKTHSEIRTGRSFAEISNRKIITENNNIINKL